MDVTGGIYIHVPFCRTRCIYCDFYSTTNSEEWRSLYVDALIRELTCRHSEASFSRVHSIYIGGGTPSLLEPQHLLHIFHSLESFFSFTDEAEITLEANPDDVTGDWLLALRDTPVNRISIGVQSLDDDLLRTIRRRHTARQALDAVDAFRDNGYQNISVDLIYGLPGQTLTSWQQDVRRVLDLQIPHLSAYALQVEEGTRLKKMIERDELSEADEELSLEMYERLLDETAGAGMAHYEISNFCIPGFHSRHNLGYWHQLPYLGLGPGAHSYDGKACRRWNLPGLRAYVESVGDVPHDGEELDENELYDELIMTRLRTQEGLPLNLLNASQREYCLKMAGVHLQNGRLTQKNDHLCLTRRGIFVSDDIMSDLMR